MGEYVKLHGESVKIGTCESLYYTTAQQFKTNLEFMKAEEGGLAPSEYLTCGEFRFRFPFPDEDSIGIGEHTNFDRGFLIRLNRADEDVNQLFPKDEDWWQPIQGRIHSKSQPHLSVFAKAENPNKDAAYVDIEIVAQKATKSGKLAVVYRDPYTGNMARIEDPNEAILLARAILRTVDPKWNSPDTVKFYMELCKRIVQGYGLDFE